MVRLTNLTKMAARVTGEQVYEELHGQIVRSELRPGEALSETRIAERFGMSRTPVREVFWRLGEAGFVRVVPQVGTFVTPINIPAVYDSQFVRETLECRAVAEAARRTDAAGLEKFQHMLERQQAAMAAQDFAAFFVLDEAMHRTIMETAGHPFAWQVIAGAKAQLDRVRFLSLEENEWPDMIMAQHRALVAALIARDADAAVRIMTAHLRTAFAAIDRIAAKHPDFFVGSVPTEN